jgi:hypothetical protein
MRFFEELTDLWAARGLFHDGVLVVGGLVLGIVLVSVLL